MPTGFHYALRSQDPAGLLTGGITLHPRGLVIAVLAQDQHSERNAKLAYAQDRRPARYRPGQTPS